MDPWKRRFLLETIISRFQVNFWGCSFQGLFVPDLLVISVICVRPCRGVVAFTDSLRGVIPTRSGCFFPSWDRDLEFWNSGPSYLITNHWIFGMTSKTKHSWHQNSGMICWDHPSHQFVITPLFTRFYISQVVQDFFHQEHFLQIMEFLDDDLQAEVFSETPDITNEFRSRNHGPSVEEFDFPKHQMSHEGKHVSLTFPL